MHASLIKSVFAVLSVMLITACTEDTRGYVFNASSKKISGFAYLKTTTDIVRATIQFTDLEPGERTDEDNGEGSTKVVIDAKDENDNDISETVNLSQGDLNVISYTDDSGWVATDENNRPKVGSGAGNDDGGASGSDGGDSSGGDDDSSAGDDDGGDDDSGGEDGGDDDDGATSD